MTATGLTVAVLAAAKKMTVEFLTGLGVRNAPRSSVAIPYRNENGQEVAVRRRLALDGPDRFRWRKGDRLVPYGLDRLPDARKAGYVTLVEGETDCWTLWSHDEPALGIPGKSTWQREWAKYVCDLDVRLWQEPGADGLTADVGRDLPSAKVLIAPEGTKDVTDALIQGMDVPALLARLLGESRTAAEILASRREQRLRDAHKEAEVVLDHPDPLVLVEHAMRAAGYGGDVTTPMLVYLALTTRLLPLVAGSMPAHTIVLGPASAGKNTAVRAATSLLPDDAVIAIDAASPAVLVYDDAPITHRAIIFGEADSLPAGEDSPIASAIRSLLADGTLSYKVTVADPTGGRRHVEPIQKPGPAVLVTTSTRSLGEQLMSRLFSIEVPDDPEQIRAALRAQVALELGGVKAADPALVKFQAYLQACAPIDVIVPFIGVLVDHLVPNATAPRLQRDVQRLRALIKAAAVVRIAHRQRDAHGRLIATIDDYRAVHRLAAGMYAATVGVSDRVRDVVDAVKELLAGGTTTTCTNVEVAAYLGLPVATAWRRIGQALQAGFLINDEGRPRQKALLRLGDPLPSTSGLPEPDLIAAGWGTVETENAKTNGAPPPAATDDNRPADPSAGVFAFSLPTVGDSVDGDSADGRDTYNVPIEEEYSRSAWDIDESDDDPVDVLWDPTGPDEPGVHELGFPLFE